MQGSPSASQPFAFFEYIILYGAIAATYKSHCDEVDTFGGLLGDPDEDFYTHPEKKRIQPVESGETNGIRNSFYPVFRGLLHFRKTEVIMLLQKRTSAFNSVNEIMQYIETVTHNINYLITQLTSRLLYQQSDVIKQALEEMLLQIHSRYNFTIPAANNDIPVLNNIGSSSFGFKKGIQTIRKLYNSLEQIGFFSEEDNQQEAFFSTLTGNQKHPLKIACTNLKAAYILRTLEPLFENLSLDR